MCCLRMFGTELGRGARLHVKEPCSVKEPALGSTLLVLIFWMERNFGCNSTETQLACDANNEMRVRYRLRNVLAVACCAHASSSADGELVSTSLHFPVQKLKSLQFIINLSAVCYDSIVYLALVLANLRSTRCLHRHGLLVLAVYWIVFQCCATSLLSSHWHPSGQEHVRKPFDLRYPSFHQREMLSRYRFSQASVGSSVTCCHLFVFCSQFAVGMANP
jgi:hypothetical protein